MRRIVVAVWVVMGAMTVEALADPAPTVVAQRGRRGRKRVKAKPAPVTPAPVPEAAPAPATPTPPPDDAAAPGLQRSNRVEFDARLVRGEKASGAVYLFHRAPRRLPGLVHTEPHYLDQIVLPVLQRPADPAPAAAEPASK